MINSKCRPECFSYRDPAGGAIRVGDAFFRRITASGWEDWRRFNDSGLAKDLVADGWLLPFGDAEKQPSGEWLAPVETLDFVSYSYEWAFGQLRDAAVLTLELLLRALEYGMTLKDASSCNVQRHRGRMIFMDHGSFTLYREGEVWAGYRQFVSHFLGPLLLMARGDRRHQLQLRNFPDGLPLDYVAGALPQRCLLSLPALVHIYGHAWFQKRLQDTADLRQPEIRPLPKKRFQILLLSLRDFLAGLKSPSESGEWSDYYEHTSYSETSFLDKQRIVRELCREVAPHRVVDLGANTGVFSRIAAETAEVVIAADVDFPAVDRLYGQLQQGAGGERIYPLQQDLCCPSPGLGVLNRERLPFLERARGDLVLGLALIHHLAIGNNWPLPLVGALFAELAPVALVEFVPKADRQVKRLLRTRRDIFPEYGRDGVLAAFGRYYRRVKTFPIAGSERELFLFDGRIE